jgi:nucleotide-binding universal stress UspA family protein
MFEKILVPLDGSEVAEEALQPAMALAAEVHGEVLLLHSLIPVYTDAPVMAGEYEWIWPVYAREDSRNEVRTYLEGVRRRADCPDCLVRAVIREGDVAGVIVDTAEEEQVDLIVMTPAVREGAARHLLGNITERVLHAVTCPVLIYRQQQPIRRILIPLDGSELAEKAVVPALEIARRLGASVVFLRVTEAVKMATAAEVRPGFDRVQVADQVRQAGEAYLQSAVERFATPGVRIQTAVVDGRPAERILDYAQLVGTDLIAMSTHGRTGLRRWIYGSVSATVMRATTCSVLVIRPEAHELVG